MLTLEEIEILKKSNEIYLKLYRELSDNSRYLSTLLDSDQDVEFLRFNFDHIYNFADGITDTIEEGIYVTYKERSGCGCCYEEVTKIVTFDSLF